MEIPRNSLRLVILSSLKKRLLVEQEFGAGAILGGEKLIPSASVVLAPPKPAPQAPTQQALKVEKVPLEKLMSNRSDEPFTSEPMSREQKIAALQQIAEQLRDCVRCGVNPARLNMVFGEGDPDATYMFIGEAPGRDEDEQGVPFVGRSGQLLGDIIEKGMKLPREKVYIANVLKCRPPDNRTPTPAEAAICGPNLEHQIEIIRPRAICLLGAVAFRFLMNPPPSCSLGMARGAVHSYRGIPVVVTYHPSYLLRNPAVKKDCWADIQRLLAIPLE